MQCSRNAYEEVQEKVVVALEFLSLAGLPPENVKEVRRGNLAAGRWIFLPSPSWRMQDGYCQGFLT